MTEQAIKNAAKENNKEELLNILNPILTRCSDMLKAGILKKNVVRFLNNNNITGAAAKNIVDVAFVRAAPFM